MSWYELLEFSLLCDFHANEITNVTLVMAIAADFCIINLLFSSLISESVCYKQTF